MESESKRESIRKAIRDSMMKRKIKDSKTGNLNRNNIRRHELLEKIRNDCIEKRKDELRKQVYRLELNKSLLEEELKRLEEETEKCDNNEDKDKETETETKKYRKSVERSRSSEHASEFSTSKKLKKKKKKKKKISSLSR
mmetsp:Transcript_7641/g.10018  ORF Transcript_7641/g.10018 Transcript_7641/m.10018 type:complete len:140 (-) Transcript_7641:484-903(-)